MSLAPATAEAPKFRISCHSHSQVSSTVYTDLKWMSTDSNTFLLYIRQLLTFNLSISRYPLSQSKHIPASVVILTDRRHISHKRSQTAHFTH